MIIRKMQESKPLILEIKTTGNDNKKLSIKAFGILTVMKAGKGHTFTITELMECSSDSRKSIQDGLNELEDAGCIKRVLISNKRYGYVEI